MALNKIEYFVGYNQLRQILEQERQNWLMKTDKIVEKTESDYDGSVYRGTIDNCATDIMLRTEKTDKRYDRIHNIFFENPAANNAFSMGISTLPYTDSLRCLLYARIKSTNFSATSEHKTYKFKMTNCERRTFLIGDPKTEAVYKYEWLVSTTVPTVLTIGSDGKYSVENDIRFAVDGDHPDRTANPIYYFPLSDELQPIHIEEISSGTYVTDVINDNRLIGYPMFWCQTEESHIGPLFEITNGIVGNKQYVHVANVSNMSKYSPYMYFGVDNVTPVDDDISNYIITCETANNMTWSNTKADYSIPINVNSIRLSNVKNPRIYYPLNINCSDKTFITLCDNIDSRWYRTIGEKTAYCYIPRNYDFKEMVPSMLVHLDEDVSFDDTTDAVGSVGISMFSVNHEHKKYPIDLSEWDGIPTWFLNQDLYGLKHTMLQYANMSNSETSKTAGLLFDSNPDNGVGRVYMLSDDSTDYHNNRNTQPEYVKPDRTLARICDIPTSIVQLTGIDEVAPSVIVDKRYIRSYASYTEDDKYRLYNVIGNRWVRPIDLDMNGEPITSDIYQEDRYIFTNLLMLNKVDLINHNDYRKTLNLNPKISSTQISIESIIEPGANYKQGDVGVIIIGGYSLHYTVDVVGKGGYITELHLTPTSSVLIPVANFNMMDVEMGITTVYGTSPITGTGGGLQLRLRVNDYDNAKPYKGDVFNDLFAFIKDKTGLLLYAYEINQNSTETPKTGEWKLQSKISDFEDIGPRDKYVSLTDAYMSSIIPITRRLPVSTYTNGISQTTIDVISTPNMINVIEKNKTPLKMTIDGTATGDNIDMCKYYCEGLFVLTANEKTVDSVIKTIVANRRVRYDSYVIWKWIDPNDINNLRFQCGVVYSSFNNLISTDTKSYLPENNLPCNDYVNTNPSTSIVWNIKNIGNMLWVYNNNTKMREEYELDPDTQQLCVERFKMKWSDVDVRQQSGVTRINIIENGKLMFNILTNKTAHVSANGNSITGEQTIYDQPELQVLDDALYIGMSEDDIPDKDLPTGNWQLVFPRIQSYRFENKLDDRVYNATRLDVVRVQNDIGTLTNVTDDDGNIRNGSVMIVQSTVDGLNQKIYNSQTGRWEKV